MDKMDNMDNMDNMDMDSVMFKWQRAKIVLYEMLILHRGYVKLCQHATNPYILFLFKRSFEIKETMKPDILVYFCDREKLNIEGLKEVIETLQSFQIKKCILIYKSMMTASSKKALDHMFDYDIELWNLAELQYNLTQHELYVPHERLRENEISQCIQAVDIPRLPKISKNDPVVRFFGWKRNNILRILRKDGSIAYRLIK